MPVMLKDIARELNLSIATVSRALDGYESVAVETRHRVRAAAHRLGYVPDSNDQRLRKGRTDAIGCVMPTFGPRFSDPFFSELLAGIGNEAARGGFDLLVATGAPGAEERQTYRRLVAGRRVDGLLLVRTRHQDERIKYLASRNFPFVAYGRSDLDLTFPYVDGDGVAGMRQLVQHLVELGHRRIACISASSQLMFVGHRWEGYRQALATHGLVQEDTLIQEADLTQLGGHAAAQQLLAVPNPPSAIVCFNDLMALGAMRAVQERGMVVGRDVSIAGFDDIPPSEVAQPPLTTVSQPIYEIGERLCGMLLRLLRGETLEQPQVLLTPHLVVRQSTGIA